MPSTATVLEIAKNVAAAIGFQPPDTLRSNQDPNSRLLLSLINRGGRILAAKRGPFGESWVELTRQHITETVAGQADYALPEGFAGLITDTVWDRSTYREAPGPLTPQQWQRLQGGLIDTVALTPQLPDCPERRHSERCDCGSIRRPHQARSRSLSST